MVIFNKTWITILIVGIASEAESVPRKMDTYLPQMITCDMIIRALDTLSPAKINHLIRKYNVSKSQIKQAMLCLKQRKE